MDWTVQETGINGPFQAADLDRGACRSHSGAAGRAGVFIHRRMLVIRYSRGVQRRPAQSLLPGRPSPSSKVTDIFQ